MKSRIAAIVLGALIHAASLHAADIALESLAQLKSGDSIDAVREKLGPEEPCEVVLGFAIYKDRAKEGGVFWVFFSPEDERLWFVAHLSSSAPAFDQVEVVWPKELRGQKVGALLEAEKKQRANKRPDGTSAKAPPSNPS